MMDIKRSALWVVFIVSLLMLYNNWQSSHGGAPLFSSSATLNKTPPTADKATVSDLPSAAKATTSLPAEPSDAQKPMATGEKIILTTDTMRAQFDTLGGNLTQLALLQHVDKEGKPIILFNEDAKHTYIARSGLVGATDLPNHYTLFQVLPGPHQLEQDKNQLSFSVEAEKNGVKLVKTYTFQRGSYLIATRFEILNQTNQPLAPTLYLELLRDNSKIDASHFYSTFTGPAIYTDSEKFKKVEFSDIDKGNAKYPNHAAKGETSWISMVQHYFASAWIPVGSEKRDIYIEKLDDQRYRAGIKQLLPEIAPGASAIFEANLFAGPQEEHALEKTAPGLELVKDYGWLTIIAKPLFWLLEKLHGLLGNWGWAIVAVTVLLKLAFFPLSAASYKSMARMKALQPRITTLRERHKGDAQKMNQAMMELYRAEKINPLGGCFPILIQIPVFIALYWVLLASVEMRNAPWIGWIHDLSSPDPYYVLPILMAVSMFVQTKLNPTPPDPLQAKMMMIMPLVFSFMFFFFPAGLVLYWVVNNILSIAQQWQIGRMHGDKKD